MPDDRRTERLALLGVAHRDVQGALREPGRDGRDAETARVKTGQRDR